MSELRLPSFWKGMGWTAKAGWLLSSRQAKDYPDACRILNSLKNPKRPLAPKPIREPEKLWYQKD